MRRTQAQRKPGRSVAEVVETLSEPLVSLEKVARTRKSLCDELAALLERIDRTLDQAA